MAKGKMPPELLEHFKKKQGDGDEKQQTSEEKQESDKEKRKEAVRKSRTRLEEKSRRSRHDQDEKTGQASTKASR